MTVGTTIGLCLLLATVCSCLVLERLPRHIPSHRNADDSMEDDESISPSFDSSVEKRKIVQVSNRLGPLILKPTWKAILPFSGGDRHIFKSHKKRDADQEDKRSATSEDERDELANILKDDNQEEDLKGFGSKGKEDKPPKHNKTKRQSTGEAEKVDEDIDRSADAVEGDQEQEQDQHIRTPDFQEWLRHEYYRNMAKSFASMRRKRNGGSTHDDEREISRPKRDKRAKKTVSFDEVTDNLRAIEDVLFLDALHTIKESGDEYEDESMKQRRITNDLSSAYDLETMRNALFRLRDTLGDMEQDQAPEEEIYRPYKKRGDQCPPLELLTSDCSTLGDIVPDGPLKRLLLHACNWHEVCYTCGEVFGLTSENCDVGFIEQSQTICRGDVPCESTASLLLLPLRQRRVFYKRSNPSVCLVDSCVEDFLKQA